MDHSPNGSSGHEHREANVRLIVLSAIGLAVCVVAVLLIMWGTFNVLKTQELAEGKPLSPLAAPVQLPPEPRLEEKPWEQIQRLRARENRILNTYGWQDQKTGVVRIPINRAMDIIAQRGFPAPPVQPAANSGVRARQVGSQPAIGDVNVQP